MAHQILLLAVVSSLFTLSSGSFFLFRQPNSANKQQTQSQNTVRLPSHFGNTYVKNDNNNNNNNNYNNPRNNRVEETTTEKPLATSINERCVQRSARDFRSHPQDCGKFTMCSGGALLTIDCPPGSVFHDVSKSCVPQGSYYDTCTRRMTTLSTCPRGSTEKKAHPRQCAQYYHCGQPAQERVWEEHLRECPYPMLFNLDTRRCEHHSMVDCGTREEPVDPCEYKANNCDGRAQCIPCTVRNPSCRERTDGMNSWKGREGSPYYVVCATQRVVYHGMCPQDHGVQVFDHEARVCKKLESGPW
ncbi:uncharacterized protein LOC101859542 [Aplysia californica]|uniref:Uncharacterized protein LOC101859542 n=1 Tax=Aplysia californica TaxID=6500 RepID=A0ABM0KB12_APLCA|nr:uncharacterized protein LOC101859542 [Aplysia californica]